MTEYFDVYDKDFQKTGKIVVRGSNLSEGEYHLVVDVILYNAAEEVLLQKRADDKAYCPGYWGLTGGAVDAGEDSLAAIIRETKEEIGVNIKPDELTFFCRQNGVDAALFVDIFTAPCNLLPADMKMQKEEVSELRWCTAEEFENFVAAGIFMPTLIKAVRKFFSDK